MRRMNGCGPPFPWVPAFAGMTVGGLSLVLRRHLGYLTETSRDPRLSRMTQHERGNFQLSLSEAQLLAPETPQYLEIALRLLETRLGELQGGGQVVTAAGPVLAHERDITPEPRPEPTEIKSPVPETPEPDAFQSSSAAPATPQRRARWFQDQYPRITLPDGAQVTPRSLDELKALLQARGLTPHPRGDASMLLWQVRNRLGGTVESVGAPSP